MVIDWQSQPRRTTPLYDSLSRLPPKQAVLLDDESLQPDRVVPHQRLDFQMDDLKECSTR